MHFSTSMCDMEAERFYKTAKTLMIIAAAIVLAALAAGAAEWLLLYRGRNQELYDVLFTVSVWLQIVVLPCAAALAVIGIVKAAKAAARGMKRAKALIVFGAVTACAAVVVGFVFIIARSIIIGMGV